MIIKTKEGETEVVRGDIILVHYEKDDDPQCFAILELFETKEDGLLGYVVDTNLKKYHPELKIPSQPYHYYEQFELPVFGLVNIKQIEMLDPDIAERL